MQSEPVFWQHLWRYDVLERGLAASDSLAFVWEEAGQLLGFACAHDLGFRAYLSALLVAESARGKDVGSRLVQRVEHELCERGCAILITDAWQDTGGFYKSLGWSQRHVVLLRKQLANGASQQRAAADGEDAAAEA